MNDTIGKMGILDKVSPKAWMHTYVYEFPAGLQHPSHFTKHRRHVTDVCVEIGAYDGWKGSIGEGQAIGAGLDQLPAAVTGHAQLIPRQVEANDIAAGGCNCRVVETTSASQVKTKSASWSKKL
jgi:hypothetical protein